jgi:type IV pilus biogenesis protein CpaD/CtpE
MIAPMARIATLITASAATVALLAGCSAGPLDLDIAVDTDGTPTMPVEAVTDEPLVDIATLATGDQLTKEQALDINRDFTTGVRGYQMADGSWIAIRKESPLPEAVRAEIAVEVAGLANAAPLGDSREVVNALSNARYNTNRSFVAVGPVKSSCSEGGFGPNVWSYGVLTDKTYVEACVSRAEAVAFAENWIANKADAGQWELLLD